MSANKKREKKTRKKDGGRGIEKSKKKKSKQQTLEHKHISNISPINTNQVLRVWATKAQQCEIYEAKCRD